jgi:predicted transposase YbfD/YdcC
MQKGKRICAENQLLFSTARVFSLINPTELHRCFGTWIMQIYQLLTWDIVSIDGKTARGSSHKAANEKAIHRVNAFSPRQKVSLVSVKTPDKSNEIKAIPVLLNQLNVAGCIVTTDAMGTQRGISKLIRAKKAHYTLALKENHKRLYRKVDHLFNRADDLNYNGMVYHKISDEKNYDHSRIEDREYTILPSMYLPQYQSVWADITAFVRVKTVRHVNNEIQQATRYYITSIPFKKYQKMKESIREHWGVENRLHYKLDVGLHEDDCPIYRGHAAENLCTMR